MKKLLTLILFTLFCTNAFATADNIYTRLNYPQPRLLDNDSRVWPAFVAYASDGNGNVSPLSNGGIKANPVHLVGYTDSIGTSSVDVWEGSPSASAYVFPTTGIQMAVVSSSASDASSSTGAFTVGINYLNTLGATGSETISLNGTTVVRSVATNIKRINSFYVASAGSSAVTVGNVLLTAMNGSATPTYAKIVAGRNTSRQIIYTVPLGQTLYVSGFNASAVSSTAASAASAGTSQVIDLKSTDHNGTVVAGIFHTKASVVLNGDSVAKKFEVPLVFPAGSDVKASAVSGSSNSAQVMYNLEGWLE